MARILLEAAFGISPFVEPTTAQWVNLTSTNSVRRLAFRHGRRSLKDFFDPSEIVLVLDNENRELDPMNELGTYHPNVKRDAHIRVRVDTGETQNKLTMNQATFDLGNATGWENEQNANLIVVNSGGNSPYGDYHMRVVATAAGTMGIRTVGTGTAGIPIGAGKVTVQARTLPNTTSRATRFVADFYNSAGSLLAGGVLGTLEPAPSASAWSVRAHTFTAPNNTAFMRVTLRWDAVALNEEHNIDASSVAAGDFAPWTIPGGIYPLFRGYAMTWDHHEPIGGVGREVTLVAHDISRLFAEHRLWGSIYEHDVRDGFAGPIPNHFYVMQASDDLTDLSNPGGVYDGTTTNNPGSTDRMIVPNDSRPLMKFGGGAVYGAQTAFIPSSVIQGNAAPGGHDPGQAWVLEFLAQIEEVGNDQVLIHTSAGSLLVMVLSTGRLRCILTYSDNTTVTQDSTGELAPGMVHLIGVTCDTNGDFRLYLDNAYMGGQAGNLRTPKAFGSSIILGADNGGGRGFKGAIGRFGVWNVLRNLANHQASWTALQNPWTHTTSAGARFQFLLEEFRNNFGGGATKYPGIPAAWIRHAANTTPKAMRPDGRSLLDYNRALAITAAGNHWVGGDGIARLYGSVRKNPVLIVGESKVGSRNETVVYHAKKLNRIDEVVGTMSHRNSGPSGEDTLKNTTAIAEHGNVHHTLPTGEWNSKADQFTIAQNWMDYLSRVPPPIQAIFSLRAEKVGWANVLQAVTRWVRVDGKDMEVQEIWHDAAAGELWETTIRAVEAKK